MPVIMAILLTWHNWEEEIWGDQSSSSDRPVAMPVGGVFLFAG